MKAVILDAAMKTDGAHMKTSRSVVAALTGAGVLARVASLIALAMPPGARAAERNGSKGNVLQNNIQSNPAVEANAGIKPGYHPRNITK